MVEEDGNMLNCLFMYDEAHFYLNGNMNKQNCRIRSASNPQILHETELHPLRVTVWCAVLSRWFVGPYFLEENGHTVTVTGDSYLSMLREFFYPELRRMRISFNSVWFQQDGAAPHIAQPVMTELRRKFPNKLISRNPTFRWPPRSPDLTAPVFFLWGYCKQEVYKAKINKFEWTKAIHSRNNCGFSCLNSPSSNEQLLGKMPHMHQRAGWHLNSIIFKAN